jgi:hypothetical protein
MSRGRCELRYNPDEREENQGHPVQSHRIDWKVRLMISRWLPLLFLFVAGAAGAATLPGLPAAQPAPAPAPPTPAEPEAVTKWSQETLERIIEIRGSLGGGWSLQQQQSAFDAAAEKYETHFRRLVEHPEQIADLSDLALEDATREFNSIANTVTSIDNAIEGALIGSPARLRRSLLPFGTG